MSDEQETKQPKRNSWLYRLDGLVKTFVPNFNLRAVLYISLLFAVAIYLQIWRISPQPKVSNPKPSPTRETVIADETYWQSQAYKEKIQTQTVESFTGELQQWLEGKNQELVRRKFEDLLFINSGLTPLTGGDLSTVVPESFNYLENHARARYQYAKDKGFLSDQPTLVKLGGLVCDLDDKTEKATGIELYDWRYSSMAKLAEFIKTSPDWKAQIGDKILDVRDPNLEDKDLLKSRNAQTQPAGLFSFLVLRDSQSNRIFLADNEILEKNGVDSQLTLSRISVGFAKSPKIYFKYGYEGCKQINNLSQINYGQPD
ncbi:MAG: hypothetical protein M1383_05320 [Patescibacteria group bacterium]|nr:hypothetical protein [Patescibacteria group bacterium]